MLPDSEKAYPLGIAEVLFPHPKHIAAADTHHAQSIENRDQRGHGHRRFDQCRAALPAIAAGGCEVAHRLFRAGRRKYRCSAPESFPVRAGISTAPAACAVLKIVARAGLLHGGVLTITRRTMAGPGGDEDAPRSDQDVIRPWDNLFNARAILAIPSNRRAEVACGQDHRLKNLSIPAPARVFDRAQS